MQMAIFAFNLNYVLELCDESQKHKKIRMLDSLSIAPLWLKEITKRSG
jgi:hypothetical protein